MNVLIHMAAGFGIALAICKDNIKHEVVKFQSPNHSPTLNAKKKTLEKKLKPFLSAVSGAFVAFVSHGLLDYAPHGYPIDSKVDVILGFVLLISLSLFAKGNYKLIIFATLLGSILPDIIDLLPSILNQQLGFNFTIYSKIFPWHWKKYSGSIYNGDCGTSNLNIALVLLGVLLIIVLKFELVKSMYFRK